MMTTKKFFLSACIVMLSATLFAQLSVGLRGGVNIAKQTYDADGFDISPDNIIGLTLAGIIELGLTENLAIQPELAFVQKGFKFEFEDISGEKTTSKLRINHIDVPVLVKYKFGGETIGAYLAAGPTFGYAITGSSEEDGDKTKFEDEDWEGYNRFELGGSLGGGLKFGKLFLDLRYLLSFSNLTDESDVKAHNNGISISLGFLTDL